MEAALEHRWRLPQWLRVALVVAAGRAPYRRFLPPIWAPQLPLLSGPPAQPESRVPLAQQEVTAALEVPPRSAPTCLLMVGAVATAGLSLPLLGVGVAVVEPAVLAP